MDVRGFTRGRARLLPPRGSSDRSRCMTTRARSEFCKRLAGFIIGLVVISPGISTPITVSPLPESEVRSRVVASLKYSDLVFRGTITQVSSKGVPAQLLYPRHPGGDEAETGVEVLSVIVRECIKGQADSRITVLVPTAVALGTSFQAGQELIMCVDYSSSLNAYVVKDLLDGVLDVNGGVFTTRSLYSSAPIRYRQQELRTIISSTDLDSLVSRSDCVVVGVVTAISEGVSQSDPRVVDTKLNIEIRETLRGQVDSESLLVHYEVPREQFGNGHAVRPAPGETWYLMLDRQYGTLTPVDGSNAMLKDDGTRLLYNGRVPYWRSRYELRRVATQD